jgi:hypothetical protein
VCTSSGKSGLLIDDFKLHQPIPMELVGITTAQQVAPVLVRKDANAVLQVKVDIKGSLAPMEVTEITITSDGTTTLRDIDSVQLFYTGGSDAFSAKLAFAASQKPASKMVFRGGQVLDEGTNNFWVSL